MMRGMSAHRLQELMDFEQMESPEWRMDLRFALLAELVAASGGLKIRGETYQQGHFFRELDDRLRHHDSIIMGEITPAKYQPPKQDVKTMIMHLDAWISGSNRALQERQGKVAYGQQSRRRAR